MSKNTHFTGSGEHVGVSHLMTVIHDLAEVQAKTLEIANELKVLARSTGDFGLAADLYPVLHSVRTSKPKAVPKLSAEDIERECVQVAAKHLGGNILQFLK